MPRLAVSVKFGYIAHIWSIGELIDAATAGQPPPPRMRPFTVIQGGRHDLINGG